jgi:hypothetical protein
MSTHPIAQEIAVAIEGFWSTYPADIEHLAATHRPPSRDLPKRLYANFDLYGMAGVFYFFLRQLREHRLANGWDPKLLGAYALECAARLDKWGLSSAASILRTAHEGMVAEAGSVGHVAQITETLIVYLNRLQAWVDATIPWAALDELDPLDGRGV